MRKALGFFEVTLGRGLLIFSLCFYLPCIFRVLEEVCFNPKNRLSVPPRRMLDPAHKDTETITWSMFGITKAPVIFW